MHRSDGRHTAKQRRARHWLFVSGVFAALFSMMLIASPASAMTTSEAIKACDANPNCEMKWGAQNDSITMRVKGSDKVIDCPKKDGPCVAVIKPKGQGVDTGGDRPNATLSSDSQGGQKFRASLTAVLTACKDSKGIFADDLSRFCCNKANCDWKGGICTVKCSTEGHCQACTPKTMVGNVTILMILQNGSNVRHSVVALEPNHQDNTSAAPSAGGSSASPAGGQPPVGGPSFL